MRLRTPIRFLVCTLVATGLLLTRVSLAEASTCLAVWYGTPTDRTYLTSNCVPTGEKQVGEGGYIRLNASTYVGYEWSVGADLPE